MALSPALFLTAAAQRMRHIVWGRRLPCRSTTRCGSSKKSACSISSQTGRLERGVGGGVTPYQLRYFGSIPSDAPIFMRCWRFSSRADDERLTFQGEHYQYHYVPMNYGPAAAVSAAVKYFMHVPESVMNAARMVIIS